MVELWIGQHGKRNIHTRSFNLRINRDAHSHTITLLPQRIWGAIREPTLLHYIFHDAARMKSVYDWNRALVLMAIEVVYSYCREKETN